MSIEHQFLENYFQDYQRLIRDQHIHQQLIELKEVILKTQQQGGKLILAGNGASAAISAHVAVDFTKQAKVRAITFNEVDLITCFANDYGYEHWIAQALAHYADTKDMVILISVSGASMNVINAAKYARDNGLSVITLTGKAENNPLRQLGNINLWVDSAAYNIVECTHMMWLTAVIDLIIGKAEYAV